MKRAPRPMIVAGVMSGTSADGIDVAIARIAPGTGGIPKISPLGHRSFRYTPRVREAVLRTMEGVPHSAAEISRLHWRLGAIYADCIVKAQHALNVRAELIGLHGQTVYHQASAKPYLGAPVRATWQLGEPAAISEKLALPVISDFRPADLAAGGQGAPLVPMLDFCMFRSKTVARILLNLGGIANITIIPANATIDQVIAFDIGPANMVIDALMMRHFNKPFDAAGRTAARSKILAPVLSSAMRNPYFSRPVPKSCGREQFGAVFTERFAIACERAAGTKEDTVATATALTVTSVSAAITSALAGRHGEVLASGGGTHNVFLMSALQGRLAESGISIASLEAFGVESQAKEALAFALLAWLSRHGLPGNVPSATGAQGKRVLGKLTC